MVKERTKSFSDLNGLQKLQFIWDYYKFPVILGILAIYALVSIVHSKLTQKETAFYLAIVNVAANEKLINVLGDDFLEFEDLDSKKNEVYMYSNLYLAEADTENAQIVAASQMKILAGIQAQELDVVIASEEVLEAFEEKEYLVDLSGVLDTSIPLHGSYSVDLSTSDLISSAGYQEPMYLGIISNSPRQDITLSYVRYLFL